jgi:hypothetical protein
MVCCKHGVKMVDYNAIAVVAVVNFATTNAGLISQV